MLLCNLDRSQFQRLRPALRDVYAAAYEPLAQYAYQSSEEIESYLEWLYAGDPGGFFVAGFDHTIVRLAGFAAVHGNWRQPDGSLIAELHELVVAPPWQGQGIGAALLGRVIQYARELGRKAVGGWVGEHNQHALTIFQCLGFRRLGQSNCWVRMELPIS